MGPDPSRRKELGALRVKDNGDHDQQAFHHQLKIGVDIQLPQSHDPSLGLFFRPVPRSPSFSFNLYYFPPSMHNYLAIGVVGEAAALKGIVEERAVELGEYIVENKATVRSAAKKYGVSKSTVHMDVI